jgi:hypothetical protein
MAVKALRASGAVLLLLAAVAAGVSIGSRREPRRPSAPPEPLPEAEVDAPAPSGLPAIDLSASGAVEGYDVRFSLSPLPGARGQPEAGQSLTAAFTVSDREGQPARGLHPLGWMRLLDEGDEPVDPAGCRAQVKRYLGGLLSEQPDVDLNGWLVMALNDDASITVINPQIALSRTRLLASISLPARGADWALHPDKERLYVTVPGAGRLSAVDTRSMRLAGSVEAGRRPTRVLVHPSGSTVWVGADGGDEVVVLDARTLETRARLPVGPGHKELAFADGGRLAFLSAEGADEVRVVDAEKLEPRASVAVGAGATALAATELARAVYLANGRTSSAPSAERKASRPPSAKASSLWPGPTGRRARISRVRASSTTTSSPPSAPTQNALP